ncbi:MAG: hypothetical protein E4H30_02645 [Methanomassiliicoccus sp.]|nr:MAG: hypothetical protein E4H30_02645 [Methanomassiliicoccus sp.]
MTVRGRRYISLFLTTAIMLSLLSLIVISIMTLFQLAMGLESQNTSLILFVFTFFPATILSWSAFVGRVIFFKEYTDATDAMLKVALTLALSMVLSTFSYYLIFNLN